MAAKRSEKSVESTPKVTRSPLEASLDRFATAYGRHLLTGAPALPAFTARLDGPVVHLDVKAPDGVQTVRRRASAYLLLAGDLWGASRAPEARALAPSLVATLTSEPHVSLAFKPFEELLQDPDMVDGLLGIAEALAPTARAEAVLLVRRLFEVGELGSDNTLHPSDERERFIPASLFPDVGVRSPFDDGNDTTTPQAEAKKAAAIAASPHATARLDAAMHLEYTMRHLLYSNHLTYFAHARPVLAALLEEGDGAVFEVALGAAQQLAQKLLARGAYAEAKEILDVLIPHHVALAESLRLRWECRLYLGDSGAEDDFARAAALDAAVVRCRSWSDDERDRRRGVTSRVATALASKANGKDPCEDRKTTKKTPPLGEEERARLLARAKALTGDAAAKPSGEKAAKAARKQEEPDAPVLSPKEYAARAKVRDASGELAAALADFEKARELRIAAGLTWDYDAHSPDILRLRRRIHGHDAAATPPSFDPDYLLDAKRSPEEREAAAARWFAQPWRTFPTTPAAAVALPYAYVLLRDVVRYGGTLWALAEVAKVDLGDRAAFSLRALPLLDAWGDRRDASFLEDVLEDAHALAFFGEMPNFDALSEKEQKPILRWVKSLVDAPRLDEAAVLAGLEGKPWARLRTCFEAKADDYDTLRDLFDTVRRAGFDGDAIATVLRVYLGLRSHGGSSLGTPKPAWQKLAAPLASLDASRLAPALIQWTRAQQKVPDAGKLEAKWLWPLYYAWSKKHVVPFLADVKKGALDNGKRLTPPQRATRDACLAWLEARR
ncbi:hypothetical protein A7982_13418 [Minicystis rosea]|nr:hypothetical protein A7982_13418 [Minicystis rosea]